MKEHKPSRNLASTMRRKYHDEGHRAPMSGVDRAGQPWKGTSRIVDAPARRRSMKRSWVADIARARVASRT